MTSQTREEIYEEIQKMKRHPAYWWNYFMLWCASKGWISVKTLNKVRWSIKSDFNEI